MHRILDLKTFPLDRPHSSEWVALVEKCRADLATDGMFNLHGFIRPEVAETIVSVLENLFDTKAFTHARDHNIYFQKSIDGLPDDHPALRKVTSSNRTLCGDQIGDSALIALYEWPEFATFLAAALGQDELFIMDDPLARINVMSYDAGQELNWHFDRSVFTTTLLLQAPEKGGDFEYYTDLRSDDDPNYAGVARMLNGEDSNLKSITLAPGALNVFHGRNTAHRVSPIEGNTKRVISVLSYYPQPGVRFTDEENIGFFGRAS